MWDVRACRSCLATKGKLEKIGDSYRRVYALIAGIEIRSGDGYPTYFCVECKMQIKKALAFRRKSRRAYFVMKEIMTVRKQVTFSDITGVNRKRTNLDSSLGYPKPNNSACYLIDKTESEEVDNTQTNNTQTNNTQTVHTQSDNTQTDNSQTDNTQTNNTQTDNTQTNDTKNDGLNNNLTKYRPLQTFNVYHTVDIPPPIEEEVESFDAEPLEVDNPEVAETDDAMDIDMNDVFKDLKDEEVDDGDDDMPEMPIKKKKKKQDKSKDPIVKISEIVNALSNADIRVMNIDEQKQVFGRRMLSRNFKRATYKCAMCLYIFNTMAELLEHVNFHNKSLIGNYLCQICKTKTLTEDELRSHVSEHHLYEYRCNSCQVVEYTLFDIVEHMKKFHKKTTLVYSHSAESLKDCYNVVTLLPEEMPLTMETHKGHKGWYKCEICNIEFKQRTSYDRHKIKHETPQNPSACSQCDVCGIWFNTKVKVAKHMEVWHAYKYLCKYCDNISYNRIQANNHKYKHNMKHGVESFTCDLCFRTLKSDAGVVFHKYSQHYNEVFIHHCNICGHSLSSPASLYQHQLTEHKRISINDPSILSDFECKICDVRFITEQALKVHNVKQNHEEAKNYEYTCLPCKKLFDTEGHYRTHMMVCKQGSRFPTKCCYCDATVASFMEYTNHFAKDHPSLQYMPVRDVTLCEQCGKPCRSSKLAQHMKTHEQAELELTCRFCLVKLITVNQYISHILTHHTFKPYHCAICHMKFKYRSECRDHILKLHAPVRPYSCKYCSREFSHIEFLNLHSVKIHNFDVRKGLKKPKRMKGKIYVYPHMKMNVSFIEPEILDQSKIQICDYLDKNNTVLINRSDHLVTDMPETEDGDCKERKRKRKTVTAPNKKKKGEEPMEEVKNEENTATGEVENEIGELNGEKYTEIEDLENETLEVIEQDGEQFVMINNVLYRIEKE